MHKNAPCTRNSLSHRSVKRTRGGNGASNNTNLVSQEERTSHKVYCGPHCGHRPPTPVIFGGGPLTSHENKSRKVRLWLGELLFCTRRKISCCVFHLFWEKMHAISYSLFHWSEREISVQVLSLPSRRRRPGLDRSPPTPARADQEAVGAAAADARHDEPAQRGDEGDALDALGHDRLG